MEEPRGEARGVAGGGERGSGTDRGSMGARLCHLGAGEPQAFEQRKGMVSPRTTLDAAGVRPKGVRAGGRSGGPGQR